VTLCAVYTVHKEMSSAGSWFGPKTKGDYFSQFGLTTGGFGFPDLGLKTGSYGFVI
jgi:hypothetical protein